MRSKFLRIKSGIIRILVNFFAQVWFISIHILLYTKDERLFLYLWENVHVKT